jgi:hypothetical protein
MGARCLSEDKCNCLSIRPLVFSSVVQFSGVYLCVVLSVHKSVTDSDEISTMGPCRIGKHES